MDGLTAVDSARLLRPRLGTGAHVCGDAGHVGRVLLASKVSDRQALHFHLDLQVSWQCCTLLPATTPTNTVDCLVFQRSSQWTCLFYCALMVKPTHPLSKQATKQTNRLLSLQTAFEVFVLLKTASSGPKK